jgi:hypothetical protein
VAERIRNPSATVMFRRWPTSRSVRTVQAGLPGSPPSCRAAWRASRSRWRPGLPGRSRLGWRKPRRSSTRTARLQRRIGPGLRAPGRRGTVHPHARSAAAPIPRGCERWNGRWHGHESRFEIKHRANTVDAGSGCARGRALAGQERPGHSLIAFRPRLRAVAFGGLVQSGGAMRGIFEFVQNFPHIHQRAPSVEPRFRCRIVVSDRFRIGSDPGC